MSQAKFEKAVAIIQALPKDGPIKPTQDDQLVVRYVLSAGCDMFSDIFFQFYKYYKQG
jgi:hypothetical protein